MRNYNLDLFTSKKITLSYKQYLDSAFDFIEKKNHLYFFSLENTNKLQYILTRLQNISFTNSCATYKLTSLSSEVLVFLL